MSRVLIICRQRLGDIVSCFPAAQHLAGRGHEVDFHCYRQYHTIFKAVSYCRPVGGEALKHRAGYERIYDLEVTRGEYDVFRASPLRLRDYMYAKYDDLAPARTEVPRFDLPVSIDEYNLPPEYALAAPTGISQVPSVDRDWFRQQCLAVSKGPWYVLTLKPTGGLPWGLPLHAKSLAHLPALIAGAATFVTINSAPNIIASGVRSSWYQVYEAGFGGQSNYEAPGQIVLHQPPELARYSWRFWVHYVRRRLMGRDTSHDFGK